MTKEELAIRLNGREYRNEITREECREAKAAGLLVAFGASDDLLEIRGVADDETGAWEGGTYELTAKGEFISRRDDHNELVREGWTPPVPALTLTAEWCPDDLERCSWRITASVPFAAFDIMEDGELYCRGCVVDLNAASVIEARRAETDGLGAEHESAARRETPESSPHPTTMQTEGQ